MTVTSFAGPVPAAALAATPRPTTPVLAATASAAGTAAPPIAPLTWLETAVAVLNSARRPLRAREIVEAAQALGCVPPSRTKTPWQSVNRDLHAAVRRGDARIVAGPGPGQFCSSGVDISHLPPAARRKSRPPVVTVPRLPIEPLSELIEAHGGLRACGIRHLTGESVDRSRWVERLHRGYLRARKRGWTSIYDADELAVKALGLHPSQVWGVGWFDAIEAGADAQPAKPAADPAAAETRLPAAV